MNRPQTPADWEKSLQAYHEILGFTLGPGGEPYLKAWCKDRMARYGRRAGQPSMVAAQRLAGDLFDADPIYVSDEMQQLVLQAVEGFDAKEPVGEDDFFLREGFAYLAEPFYSLDINNKRLAWRAASWKLDFMWTGNVDDFIAMSEEELAKEMKNEQGRWQAYVDSGEISYEPIARITLWAHENDPDDFPIDFTLRNAIGLAGTKWGISHMTSLPLNQMNNEYETINEGDVNSAWLTFVRVLNRIMAEKLIMKSRYTASRAQRRWGLRKNLPVKDILVVELRRRTPKGHEDENGEAANYSHRFIVHSHWRRQWYPSMGMHRQKWIGNYVKGPEDKPLVIKERVWNFDR